MRRLEIASVIRQYNALLRTGKKERREIGFTDVVSDELNS